MIRKFTALAAAALFSLFWALLGSQVVPAAREHDFLNLYTGATLARWGQFATLYDH